MDWLKKILGITKPPVPASTWPAAVDAKVKAVAALTPPRTLYARFDRWLEQQERKAAG